MCGDIGVSSREIESIVMQRHKLNTLGMISFQTDIFLIKRICNCFDNQSKRVCMYTEREREKASHVLAMSFIVLRGIVCQLIHIVFSCPVSMEVQSNNYH